MWLARAQPSGARLVGVQVTRVMVAGAWPTGARLAGGPNTRMKMSRPNEENKPYRIGKKMSRGEKKDSWEEMRRKRKKEKQRHCSNSFPLVHHVSYFAKRGKKNSLASPKKLIVKLKQKKNSFTDDAKLCQIGLTLVS